MSIGMRLKIGQGTMEFVIILVIVVSAAIAGGKIFGPTLKNALTTASDKINTEAVKLVEKSSNPKQAARLQNTTASNIPVEPYTGPVVRAPSWPASYPADYNGIGVPGFTPQYITNPTVMLPNGQTYAHNPLEYATLGTASTVAAMIGGVIRQSDWVGGVSTPNYGIYTPGGTYIGNAGGIATTIANNDPLTALRMLTAWGADVPVDSPLYLAAQAQLRNPNLANSGFTSPSQILGLPASLYGDVRIPETSGNSTISASTTQPTNTVTPGRITVTPVDSEAYWNSQPPEIRALRNIDNPSERLAQAEALAHRGFTIDVPIMGWGWDPHKTMELREQYGYTWVPSALQANIKCAPGIDCGSDTYDPDLNTVTPNRITVTPVDSEAYWNSQPPEVRALRNIDDPSERLAQTEALARRGFTIDVPIMAWGWDPHKTMELREQYGYTWVPSALQPNVQAAPGLTVPGMQSYDPNNPPAGSITVPQQLETNNSTTSASTTQPTNTVTTSSTTETSGSTTEASDSTTEASDSTTETSSAIAEADLDTTEVPNDDAIQLSADSIIVPPELEENTN